jgi:hypothetical protein
MSGQENTVLVPRAPLITSNELIFPSLHPFGPRYSQRPLNGKRSADLAFSLQKTLEPHKMVHSEENTAQSPLQELKTEITERDNFKVPRIPQSRKTTEKSNLGIIENGTNLAAARLVNYDNNLSLLQFLLSPERLHMEMVKHSLQMNLQSLFMNQMAKPIEKEFTPAVLTAPESEKSESPSHFDEKTPENKSELEQETTDQSEKSEAGSVVLPGFTDESEVQVALDKNVQAVVPKFHPSPKNAANGRKSPKLVWNADIEKTEKLEIFHAEVEELLEMTITDQEKLSQILKESDYDVTKALGRIEKSKGRYRFAFKIKKMLPSKQIQDKSE